MELSFAVTVPDLRSRDTSVSRVAGLLPDGETIAVARLVSGEADAVRELQFNLGDVLQLAHDALSGSERALTSPGLARKLSATVAILFRVAVDRGAIQQLDTDAADGPDLSDDRGAAGDDEDRDE